MLVGTATVAGAAPAPTTVRAAAVSDGALRVATYNIAKTTLRGGKWAWANRRVALVNAVAAASPDVLLIQEANTQLWNGVKHIDDVRGLLGSIGYQIASEDYESCTPGCTRGAHVFFNPTKVSVSAVPNPAAAVGMTALSVIAGAWDGSIQDRAVSWAFLTPRGSSRPALYVSVHMPTQKNGTAEALRVAIASRLRAWAGEIIQWSGLPSAEIVIGGDFNSYDRRQPAGAQAVLRSAGLIDGFAAPEKANANFGSVNYAPKINKYKGFPPRPYFYGRIDPCRIDYIFSSVPPLRHEIFLRLQADGTFDNAFRVSDHNMVLVDLPLR
jgi:endonuclease/exonuclease/phosphatase family metal-dependent hydrolase